MTGRNRGPQSPDCIKAPPQNHSPLNRGALLPLIVVRFPFNPAVNNLLFYRWYGINVFPEERTGFHVS